MGHPRLSDVPPPSPPLQLLDLPDDMLGVITGHLCSDDASTEATALAVRTTCTRLRRASQSNIGPALDIDPVGRLRCGTTVHEGSGDDKGWVPATPLSDIPIQTLIFTDRLAAGILLLAPSSSVRSLSVCRRDGPRDLFFFVFDGDQTAFVGTEHFEPLFAAAGRLPLHTLTVGPLAAKAVDRVVAPGTLARNTLCRLHLRHLIVSPTNRVAVLATLVAVASRLITLTIEGRALHNRSGWYFPMAGLLHGWLSATPRAAVLREFSFVGQLSAADAVALAAWAPCLTTLSLTLWETPAEAAAALALPALPHLRRLDQQGQIPHVATLLAGRPLTTVTVVSDGVPNSRTNQEPLIEWLDRGSSTNVTALCTDLTCNAMTNQLFGPTARLYELGALRTLVVLPFQSAHLPQLAQLPRLEHLGLTCPFSAAAGDSPGDADALAAFPALRSLHVYGRDASDLRPLLAAAHRLPSSVTSLALMVDVWAAQGRPRPNRRAAEAGGGGTVGASTTSAATHPDAGGGRGGGDKDGSGGDNAPPAPAGLRRLYFGYSRTKRELPGRRPVPVGALFARCPPELVLAGELASPPVGWVVPPGGAAIVPGAGWMSGWALG